MVATYATHIQIKDFFEKLNASDPVDANNDDDEDVANITPPRKRGKNNGHSVSPLSSDDDLTSALHRINQKKEKKLNKDGNIVVSSPLTLGLKCLTTDDLAGAGTCETSVSLRAAKSMVARITTIGKSEKSLDLNHPLTVLSMNWVQLTMT